MASLSPLLLALATVTMLLAGCSSSPDPAPVSASGLPTVGPLLPLILPANITDTRQVLVSAAGLPVVGCTSPLATCVAYPFEIKSPYKGDMRKATITVHLGWMLLLNNFDLVLYDHDHKQVVAQNGLPPGATADLSSDVVPGNYSIVVVGTLVVAGGYDLSVTFAPKVPTAKAA